MDDHLCAFEVEPNPIRDIWSPISITLAIMASLLGG